MDHLDGEVLPMKTAMIATIRLRPGEQLATGTVLTPVAPKFQRVGVLAAMIDGTPTTTVTGPCVATLACCCMDQRKDGPEPGVKYSPTGRDEQLSLAGRRMIARVTGQLRMRIENAQTMAQKEVWAENGGRK